MPTVIHQTTGNVKGIWFFDHDKLQELDTLIDEAVASFADYCQADFEAEVQRVFQERQRWWGEPKTKEELVERMERIRAEEQKSYPFDRNKRQVTVSFQSGRKLIVERFSEAFNRPDLQPEMPTGFGVQVYCGRCELSVQLPRYATNSVQVSVSPGDITLAPDLYIRLTSWAERTRQPNWQYFWKRVSGLQWFLWFIFLWLWFLGLGAHGAKIRGTSDSLKEEARHLLVGGLKKEDEHRAIELILAMDAESNPQPAPPSAIFSPTVRAFLVFTVFTFLLCICLSFPPATAIGIGSGTRSVEKWETWVAWFRILFFGFALLSVAGPWTAALLDSYVRGG